MVTLVPLSWSDSRSNRNNANECILIDLSDRVRCKFLLPLEQKGNIEHVLAAKNKTRLGWITSLEYQQARMFIKQWHLERRKTCLHSTLEEFTHAYLLKAKLLIVGRAETPKRESSSCFRSNCLAFRFNAFNWLNFHAYNTDKEFLSQVQTVERPKRDWALEKAESFHNAKVDKPVWRCQKGREFCQCELAVLRNWKLILVLFLGEFRLKTLMRWVNIYIFHLIFSVSFSMFVAVPAAWKKILPKVLKKQLRYDEYLRVKRVNS